MIDKISLITSSDEFTRLCNSLLAAEYLDFWQIDDSGGDGGNDGYSSSAGMLFQFYCPKKPEKANDSKYKKKISEDLDKAEKLLKEGKYSFSKWVFITPKLLREPVLSHLHVEAKARGLEGMSWSNARLYGLLTKHEKLRTLFHDLISEDLEAGHHAILDKIQQVDDVHREYQKDTDQKYDRRIQKTKQLLDLHKYETAKHDLELILRDLEQEKESIHSFLFFRVYNNLGVCEANLHNETKAANFFELAHQAEPELPKAISMLAWSKVLRGTPEEGLPIIEQLLEKHPEDEQAISIKANILYALDRHEELSTFLTQNDQQNLKNWFEGFRHKEAGHTNEAINAFKKVADAEPQEFRARFLIADVALTHAQAETRANPLPPEMTSEDVLKNLLLAKDALHEAIITLKNSERKPDLESAYSSLAGCLSALGMYKESVQAANEAIVIDPRSKIAWLNKGAALFQLTKFEEALESLEKCEELGGLTIDIAGQMAVSALQLRKLNIAQRVIEAKLEEDGRLNLPIAAQAIELYSRQLADDKLELLLERLEKEFGDNCQAIRMRAEYASRQGLDKAETLYKKAIRKAKSPSEIMLCELKLGKWYYHKGNLSAGKELFVKYLSTRGQGPASLLYAHTLYELGELGDLLQWLDQLAPEIRTRPQFMEIEAGTNLAQNNLDQASALYKRLYSLEPERVDYAVNYGMCLFRLGRSDDAKRVFNAVRNYAVEAKELANLSFGYKSIGSWDTALDLMYKALEKDPNNPNMHQAYIGACVDWTQINKGEPDAKYSAAFQKTLTQFNDRFPEAEGIQKFEMKDDDPSEMLKVVDSIHERSEGIIKLYRESPIPLAAVAKSLGKDSYDLWKAFTQASELGFRMAVGSIEEVALETAVVEECLSDEVVIDIYPLYLLEHVGCLDLLSGLFSNVYVHQSLVDELHKMIGKFKLSREQGMTSLARIDGQHQFTEIPATEIEKAITSLENIQRFVTTNPKIRGFTRNQPKEGLDYTEILSSSTRDSLLLARELDVPLYCDDFVLRKIGQHLYQLKSFSTQSLIDVAQFRELIPLDVKHDVQRAMLALNYRYVSFNSIFLHSELQKGNYKRDSVLNAAMHLARKETSQQSLATAIVDILARLLADPALDDPSRAQVIRFFMEEIGKNHDLQALAQKTYAILKQRIPGIQPHQLMSFLGYLFSDADDDASA